MFCIVVDVTWNGTRITGPVLIYHDEILVDAADGQRLVGDIAAPGALVCSTSISRVAWRRTDYVFFGDRIRPDDELSQIRSGSSVIPNLSRLSRLNEDANPSAAHQNGLWCCRVSVAVAPFVCVGVYRRGIGELFWQTWYL